MSENPDLFGHRRDEPADKFHPEHETFKEWLDSAAAQRVTVNMPKHFADKFNNLPPAGISCYYCGQLVDDILEHLTDKHRVRRAAA